MPVSFDRLIALMLLTALPLPAAAHQLGRSYSDFRPVDDGAHVLLDFDPSDLNAPLQRRFDDDGSGRIEPQEMQRHHKVLGALASGGYAVYRGGERCRPEVRDARASLGSGMIRISLWHACAKPGRWRVNFALAERLRKGHVHFLSFRSADGIVTSTLSHENPIWEEAREPSAIENVWSFFLLGLEHILTGYDHLLFLFALLLVSVRLREVVKIITAFTVAHSITLLTAALGALTLPPWLVEPTIALTIVYVGAENFFIKDASKRWALTFALGLIHGFGFSGILADTGLPAQGRVAALLSFNVGVEVGQLAVIAAVIPALAVLRRPAPSVRARVMVAAGAFASAGLLWHWETAAAIGLAVLAAASVVLAPIWGYRRVVLQGGSTAVIIIGLTWFVLRVI